MKQKRKTDEQKRTKDEKRAAMMFMEDIAESKAMAGNRMTHDLAPRYGYIFVIYF